MSKSHITRGSARARITLGVLMVAALLGGSTLVPARGDAAAPPTGGPSLLAVTLRSVQDFEALEGFDLAEARHGDEVEVVATADDREVLEQLGLPFRVLIDDLVAHDRALGIGEWSPTPVGATRTVYRRLFEYEDELKALATSYPGHVRLVTMPYPSLEGRTIYGVEIAGDILRDDGRPTSFVMGVHHAREWPSGELTMNFANELAAGYGSDPRITTLLDDVRVLIVPVVNPDGFHASREFAIDGNSWWGFVGAGQFWRKNMRAALNGPGVSAGAYGVDPNRNYGYMWGSGTAASSRASAVPVDQTYQGHAPFSEPETQNIREMVLRRNVITLLTNHTYSDLVLWPWGHVDDPAPDRANLRALGVWMAQANKYRPQQSVELYPTTGSTEDWAYAATGTYGYTFELGCCHFHPPYEQVLNMWPGNREAFLRLVEGARTPAYHSVLSGTVRGAGGEPLAASLRLTRTGETPLHFRAPSLTRTITDTVDISMTAGIDGTFRWVVNPSTRPIAQAEESYTLTVSAPGYGPHTRQVTVARGQSLSLGTIVLS